MLKLILLVPAAVLLLLAGEGIHHAVRARQQIAVACAQFGGQPLPSPRVLVAGCEIDYAGAGYRESGGQVEELFLPARPAGGPTVPAPLVVATRDPGAIALARSVLGAGRAASSQQSFDAMRAIVAQLHLSTAIEGLVRTGFIERLRTERILSGLSAPTAEDAVIVDLHGAPDFVRPGLALLFGVLLALVALRPLRRRERAAEVSPRSGTSLAVPVDLEFSRDHPELAVEERSTRPQEPPVQHDVNPRAIPASLPRLLLLALDVSAGLEAVEGAPPLGSRADVVAILRAVISDLGFDQTGNILARPDGSIRIDLGPQDPVPTAVLEARGEAGVALVKEVLIMTGWRAFAPKTGLFVGAADLEAQAVLAAEGPVL
jgi:hypothetical protein